jgi:translation elongation factor P/translation initiation factor 5A
MFDFKNVKEIKIDNVVMIKNNPCRITYLKVSGCGKFNKPKMQFIGNDIFNDNEYSDISPLNHTIEIPKIQNKIYTFISKKNMIMEVYDEKNDEIIEINMKRDKKIFDYIDELNNYLIFTIEFLTLKRVIKIEMI